MKRGYFALALFLAVTSVAQGGVILSTSNPPGSPLGMASGSVSGPMEVVVSSPTGADIMARWQISLQIIAQPGATGTLTFQDPASGPAPNPPNYIFTNGFGIAAVNTGSGLMANDSDQSPGTLVPNAPGANLLQVDFAATGNASGLFGIYADPNNSNWSSPDGSGGLTANGFDYPSEARGLRHIGDVLVSVVPEPSALSLFCVGLGVLGVSYRRLRPAIR
jgi:hypothetical protein